MTRVHLVILFSSLFVGAPLVAQDATVTRTDSTVALTVVVRRDTMPLEDVMVRSEQVGRYTDARGVAVLRLPVGERQVITTKIGFKAETLLVSLRPGVDTTVTMALAVQPLELSDVIVSATRSGRRIEDEPLRVEVLACGAECRGAAMDAPPRPREAARRR